MFGYIKPCQPELKVKELDAYKAVYCGLCGQMGRSFGPMARLALSYDFTFLSMLRYSVGDEKPTVRMCRCHVNPFKKQPMCIGDESLRLGAAAAAILLHYKLLDNVQDGKFPRNLGWKLLALWTGRACAKAGAAYPDYLKLAAGYFEGQQAVEASAVPSADAASEPTAAFLAGIFRSLSGEDTKQRVLERLGYLLGRYVYLCDALDDLEQDAASGSYNPFVARQAAEGNAPNWKETRRQASESLYMTIGEAEKTLDLLPLRDFAPIIQNTISMGLRTSVDAIVAQKEKSK